MNHLTPQLDHPSDETSMIAQSARTFFAEAGVPPLSETTESSRGYRQPIWRQMVELGWLGWNIPPEAGGSGLSFEAGLALHEELGAGASSEPLVDLAVLAAGVLRRSAHSRFHTEAVSSLLTGASSYCLAWSAATRSLTQPQTGLRAAHDHPGRIVLDGTVGFASLPEAEQFLVLADTPRGTAIYQVDRDAPGLTIQRIRRVDGRQWADLCFANTVLSEDATVIEPGLADAVLQTVQDEARLTLSAELLGAASEVLALTLEYMRIRQQFGKPLSSFQALQHRAVDLAIQVELMRSAVQDAARVFDTDSNARNRSIAASRVKARSSSAALAVIQGCIQLHGGIAYTEECQVGTYLKRAMVQAAWLGDADEQRARWADLDAADNSSHSVQQTLAPWLREMRDWIEANLDTTLRFPAKRQSWREAHSWHVKLHEQGWVAPAWPKAFGGMGLSPYEELLLHEVYETFGLNIFQNMGLTMLGPLLQKYGTPAQQQEYLPGILSGQTYWCQGYSEPEAGSDLASLRTRAELQEDHFIVNGQKIWTSLAHEADMIFLLVRTDPDAKKQQGISFLLVDMKTPGISVKPIVNLTGARDFCSVFFDNVKVPKENLVGEINQGWTMAKSVLGSERIMIGHPRFAKAALRVLGQFIQSRGIPDMAGTLHRLAADVADLEALYVRYLNVLRQGKTLGAETSILKICSSQSWQKIVATLREVSGVHGTIDERQTINDDLSVHFPFQFLHAIPSTIYGGTNDIQRNILAAQMLRL